MLVFKELANLWLRPAMLARVKVSSPMLDWIGLDWIGLDWIGLDWIGLDWIGLDWIGLEGLFTQYTPSDTTNRLLMHYDRAWSWKSTSRCHDQTNVALKGLRLVNRGLV